MAVRPALVALALVCGPALVHADDVLPEEEDTSKPSPKVVGLLVQFGNHGLGLEADLDLIPYVQIGAGVSGNLSHERARVILRGRIPVQRAQFVGGIAYASGSYSTFCFMCHEEDVTGDIRSIHTEIGFDVSFSYLRLALHGGVEWLLSDEIVDSGETVVQDRGAYILLGVGLSL